MDKPTWRGSDSPPWKRVWMTHRSDLEASRLGLNLLLSNHCHWHRLVCYAKKKQHLQTSDCAHHLESKLPHSYSPHSPTAGMRGMTCHSLGKIGMSMCAVLPVNFCDARDARAGPRGIPDGLNVFGRCPKMEIARGMHARRRAGLNFWTASKNGNRTRNACAAARGTECFWTASKNGNRTRNACAAARGTDSLIL